MKLKLESIVIGERLRKTNPAAVANIAKSFDIVGQLCPIIVHKVDGKWNLLAGAHRIEAAKSLNWTDLEVKTIDVSGYSKEMAEIIVQIVEVDENLSRADLDQAERASFIGKRIDLTGRRIALQARETAEKDKAAADAARSAALAAKKAAKDAAERKKANEEFVRAEQNRKNADKRLEDANARQNLLANKEERASMVHGVSVQVANELGLKSSTVYAASHFRKVLGEEYLQLIAGTRLASQAEMQAMVRLRKEAPERAALIEKCLKRNKAEPGRWGVPSPSGELGAFVKERAAEENEKMLRTDEGLLVKLFEKATKLKELSDDMRVFVRMLTPDTRAKFSDFVKFNESVTDMFRRINVAARPIVQKRTGTEHRYSADAPEGPTKEETRAELVKHDKAITKIVKSKGKQKKSKATA